MKVHEKSVYKATSVRRKNLPRTHFRGYKQARNALHPSKRASSRTRRLGAVPASCRLRTTLAPCCARDVSPAWTEQRLPPAKPRGFGAVSLTRTRTRLAGGGHAQDDRQRRVPDPPLARRQDRRVPRRPLLPLRPSPPAPPPAPPRLRPCSGCGLGCGRQRVGRAALPGR